MRIYKVFYFRDSGRNIILSYSKHNYVKWGFDKPYRQGRYTKWEIHLGTLHIHSLTPNNPTES